MFYLNLRSYKRAFTYLLCFAFLLAPLSAYAQSNKEAEMVALYEQAFGKKKKVIAQVAPAEKEDDLASSEPQEYDSAALFAQAFGKKKPPSQGNDVETIDAEDNTVNDLNALYAKAFGKKIARSPSTVNVELRVNKATQGDINLFSNKQGVISSTETEVLLKTLKEVLKAHIYQRISNKISKNKKVAFRTLTKLGLKTRYNATNLSLDLHVKPSIRKPRILSMRPKQGAGVRDENKITADEISAFLNMYSNIGITSEKQTSADVKVKLEGSLAIKDVVLETTLDFNNKRWDVGRTSLTYDLPDRLQRFVVGNISTGNRNFQENLELNGLRVSKEFFMKPELQIRPKANQPFVLETSSEVEVYINNQLRQRYYLPKGVYSLEDIGLYNGANNIRVRITDEFGKVTEKKSQQYYDSHLLKPKLSLFSLSVGYLSNKQAVINKKLENKPILSAYYQRGMSKKLTVSLDAQISPDSYLLGAEAISSITIGSLKNSIAFSGGSDKKTGFATRFEFRPNIQRQLISLDTLREDMLKLDTSVGRFLDSWSISGEFRSKDFSMINQDNTLLIGSLSKKLKARLQTDFSFNLKNDWNGALSLGIQDNYDAKQSLTANLSAVKRFNNGIRLSVGANYDSSDDFGVNLNISIPLSKERGKRRKDLDFLANSKDNSFESKLSVKPMGYVGKNSLSGSIEARMNDSMNQQKLNLHYRGASFETSLNARNQISNTSGADLSKLSLGFNTSIACVGLRCGTSYPINDSFALVTGPSNQDRAIAINNGHGKFHYSSNSDLPDNYTALIGKRGSSAVVPLDSYNFQTINIDESTLPNGYDVEKTEFEVFPRYHQGFLIKAGGEPSTILSGELVNSAQKPLGFKGGQWVSQSEEGKTIAFFSNKAGLFRVSSIPADTYKLELFDYPDMKSITVKVPDKKGEVHNVGRLIIVD